MITFNSKQLRNPISGSFQGDFTGNLTGTASFAVSSSMSISSSFAISASWAPSQIIDTGSLVTLSEFNAFTSSYATGSFTGSFAGDGSQLTGIVSSKWSGTNPITRTSDVEITGSLRVTDSITASLFGTASFAQTAAVAPNYLPLTGGTITGSLEVTGSVVATQGFTGSLFGTASFATSASYANVTQSLGFTPENVANKSDSFTASSTTTYANTKALVDGLATKQNTIIIASNYTNVGLTATSAETILHALLIPANTFGVGRDPKFNCLGTKVGTANLVTMRARISTSAAPSPVTSGTLIATLIPASQIVLWYSFERRAIHIDTATSTLSTNVSSVGHTDYLNAGANTVLNNNIDWTVNQYLIITAQPSNSNADVFTLHKTEIYL